MKAIILEDNLSDSLDFEMILSSLDVKVQGVYKSWKSSLQDIKRDLPDFIIVDLYLEHNEKGLDFIEEIKNLFVPVIICTSYPEQVNIKSALNAGVKAVVSKPIDRSSFTFQIEKLIKELNAQKDKDNFILVRDKGILLKIPSKDIYAIKVDGNYSFLYLESQKRYVIKLSLKKLMEQLDSKDFVWCHRSTIVNLEHIDSVSSIDNTIKLTNNMELDLARRYKKEIQERFSNP